MGPSRLPLPQIAAFEAAARHLSFTAAAAELNVQQPAISRQVALLERQLGVQLFRRTKPRLELTGAGQELYRAAARGFAGLREAMARIRPRPEGDGVIVVNAAIGFTSLFLLPRLAGFQSAHPDLRLQVVTRDQNPDYDPAECDIVVVFGTGGLEGTRHERVFAEELVPICRPALLEGRDRLSLHELADQPLLHMSNPAHAGDWARYFAGTGITPPEPEGFERIHSYMVYLRAVQTGAGIGLGYRHMIEEQIEAGQLAVACDRALHTERGYFCCITPRGAGRAGTARFLGWIAGLA